MGRSWWIGFGVVALPTSPTPTWHDQGKFLFFGPSTALCWSPSQRYVVVGETTGECSLATIANGWEQHGISLLNSITAFFALVVWDRQDQVLYLCRDGVGGRTLYYTHQGRVTWIAPRLKTLRPYHSGEINLVALRDYLCCAFVPGSQTLWQEVQELRPGTVLRLPQKETSIFWQPESRVPPTADARDVERYGEELLELLQQVVQEKLMGHDKVGIFLSGGIDSSAVTALSAQLHSGKVICYSIHFGSEVPNELFFSRLVAQQYGLEHRPLEISFREMWDYLPETMAELDDPIGDPLTVPNLRLARFAKSSVSLILNGEGGDPCFGGPKNQPMLLSQVYGGSLVSHYARSFQKCFDDLSQLLKPDVWAEVKNAPFFFADDLHRDMELLQRLFLINIKFKGADHILTKVNNLLGAVGLEGRSPLFDRRVVDFSLRIPVGCKVAGAEEKAVLKRAMQSLLPPEIIHRPKSGMMVPVQLGFQKYWNRQARDLLLGKHAAISAYLQPHLIQSWLDYQGDPWRRYGVKLWLLASLELWLQQHRSFQPNVSTT
ncbi:MAG: asparagine synthetase B family protein [Gloeomargarita sp. SKYBB_i_bin120]|nr:asparagine synthetase B family protein [Gloeomargarita sp. SKYG98]MCS7292107.1 asparagine synthetase B family protein [Gloeomargarita sp. SKYB120]MDW8177667.1 asparagine synthetase B family protein [Gloeomargarita sp. SKYBB_i_bin120]